MFKPGFAFSAGGALASLSWLCLTVSLFVPNPLTSAVWNGTTIVVPAVHGVAYAVLLTRGFVERTGGGWFPGSAVSKALPLSVCMNSIVVAVGMREQHGVEMMDAAADEERHDGPFTDVLGGR